MNVYSAIRRRWQRAGSLLRPHALSRIGPVDVIFFWGERELSPAETRKQVDMVKGFWPIEGSVRFIKVAMDRRRDLGRQGLRRLLPYRGDHADLRARANGRIAPL
jgi:hypothetical protein